MLSDKVVSQILPSSKPHFQKPKTPRHGPRLPRERRRRWRTSPRAQSYTWDLPEERARASERAHQWRWSYSQNLKVWWSWSSGGDGRATPQGLTPQRWISEPVCACRLTCRASRRRVSRLFCPGRMSSALWSSSFLYVSCRLWSRQRSSYRMGDWNFQKKYFVVTH